MPSYQADPVTGVPDLTEADPDPFPQLSPTLPTQAGTDAATSNGSPETDGD